MSKKEVGLYMFIFALLMIPLLLVAMFIVSFKTFALLLSLDSLVISIGSLFINISARNES